MAPTRIYVKPILAMLKQHAIHAMAHITGGGLSENIIRVIPDGLGLEIKASSWPLPPVFQWLQKEGQVPNNEMWRTFNCGIGFVLVIAADDVESIGASLTSHDLAHWTIGSVVKAAGEERTLITE